jgi:hypothetical protein
MYIYMIQIPLMILGLGSITRGFINLAIILFVFFGLWWWPGYLVERGLKCESEENLFSWGCDNQFTLSSLIGLCLIVIVMFTV